MKSKMSGNMPMQKEDVMGAMMPSKTPRCHYDMELGKKTSRGTEPVKKTGK